MRAFRTMQRVARVEEVTAKAALARTIEGVREKAEEVDRLGLLVQSTAAARHVRTADRLDLGWLDIIHRLESSLADQLNVAEQHLLAAKAKRFESAHAAHCAEEKRKTFEEKVADLTKRDRESTTTRSARDTLEVWLGSPGRA